MPAGRNPLQTVHPAPFSRFLTGVAVLVAGTALAASAGAQIRASELGSVSQIIDGTRIAIEYSRPRARGRTDMFGGEVKWQEVWTPGANYATTLEISKDIKLEGHAIPKGKYSVWMVVRPEGDWTFVLDPRHRLFHMEHPDSTAEQIRFPVKTETAPFTEVLTWSFPENRATGATLDMRWGTIRVPLRIAVQPTYRMAVSREVALPYVGSYDFRWADMSDSTPAIRLEIFYQDSTLVVRHTPKDDYMDNAVLIRIKDDWFIPGIIRQGELLDAIREFVYEFRMAGGKAVSFEIRGDNDEIWGRGRRR
jgi:hypothetical protein